MGKRKAIGRDPLAWIGDNDPATREVAVQHNTAAEGSPDARAAPDSVVSTQRIASRSS